MGSIKYNYLFPILLTYQRTPYGRSLFENLLVSQPVTKFPAFYTTRSFITAFTTARHLSLSSARSNQYNPSSHFLRVLLHSTFQPPPVFQVTLYTRFLSPTRATCPSNLILLNLITEILFCKQYRSLSPSLRSFLHSPVTSSLLRPNIFLSALFSNTLAPCGSLHIRDHVSHP